MFLLHFTLPNLLGYPFIWAKTVLKFLLWCFGEKRQTKLCFLFLFENTFSWMYSVTFVDNHHKNENSKKEKRFSLLITLANFLHKNLYLRNPHLSIFGSPNGLLPLVLLEARFSPQIIPLCSWGKLVHRRRSQRLRRKDAPSRVAL